MSLDELLEAEVVSASLHSQPLTRAPATVFVITAKQIEERGYEILEDILQELPGFDLTRIHGAFPTIHTIRGSYGDENKRLLLMIDGIVENNIIGSFEMGGPAYSLHHADRVEIILGPASALYGANAFSGIINVITKKGKKHKGFTFHRGYGSFNTKFDRFSLVTAKKSWDLSLSGSMFRSSGPRFSLRHPDYSDAYVDGAYSLTGRLTFKHKAYRTTFGFHSYESPMGDGTFGQTATNVLGLPARDAWNSGNAGWYPADINGQPGSRWHPFTRTFFLESSLTVSKRLNLTAQLYYRETGVKPSYSYLNLEKDEFFRNHITHQSFRRGGKVVGRLTLAKNQSLVTGLVFYRDNIEKGYRDNDTDPEVYPYLNFFITNVNARFQERDFTVQNNYGAYAQYEMNTSWLSSTAFTLGFRFDNNSLYGSTYIPRLGIVTQPFKHFSCKLLYGEAFRAPSTFELYSTAPIRIPNPELKPEKIKTVELGLSYKWQDLLLRTAFFYNHLTDLIVEDVPIGNGISQNQNVGKAKVMGLELGLDMVVSKQVKGFANFNFQHAEQRHPSKERQGHIQQGWFHIPNIAKFKGNAGLNWDFPDLMNLYLSANWVGKRNTPVTNPLGHIDPYVTFNLSLTTKRFFKKRVSAAFKVKNLFNKTYYDPGIRSASGTSIWATVHDQPGTYVQLKLMFHL